MQSSRYSCQILVKCEFYGQIFGKYSNIKLLEIYLGGTEFFHADKGTDEGRDGQTDRNDETNSGFSQFCEKRPKGVSRKN